MSQTTPPTARGAQSGPLPDASAHEMLRQREEVLEICYWYQGEGFGESFTADAIQSFLPLPRDRIAEILEFHRLEGSLKQEGSAQAGGPYTFAEAGRKKASRLFHETFAEFQTPSHYECTAGCCDGDDHSGCDHGPLYSPVRADTAPT